MKKSLQAFMRGIIDYAGLFPPADLHLDTAIQHYAEYKGGPDAWMLSRFIIPASMLGKLEVYKNELFEVDPPFSFSLLGRDTETVSDFEQEMEQLVEACVSFKSFHGKAVTADLLEITLPSEAVFSDDKKLIEEILHRNKKKLAHQKYLPSRVFYEIPFKQSWKKDIETVLKAISNHNKQIGSSDLYNYAGFKIRCGGVEAHMFPGTEQLAFAINRARKYNIAIKGTAGLHHPVRHYNDSVQTKMHGFFNVFGGAMLAHAHDLSDEDLLRILDEEDPGEFQFTEHSFSWNDLSVANAEINELRQRALISYGSCSFEEPREDLRYLGLL